ncbi:MAG: hypothetical protein ACIARR_07400, partial [Phycisphaerales bacterium JB059]
MAKRVFEIAKELGVKSKVIVEKCHAEGVPQDVIKNHMSTVSVGLEASIQDWFSSSGGADEGAHTAVETAEKVDVDKARKAAKPLKATPKAAAPANGTEAAEKPSTAKPAPKPTAVSAPPPPPPPAGWVSPPSPESKPGAKTPEPQRPAFA